jgi:hypothetical protein
MRSRLFLATFTVLLALAGPAAARGTLDSILPEIRNAHPGRLSDAEPWTDSEGRTHYKIKWLTPEGRVLYFNADADSGRYSSARDDDGAQGNGWHDGDRRTRGDGGDGNANDNGGGHRSRWNGSDAGGGDNAVGGDWRSRRGNGGGDGNGGGEGHNRERGQGDWRGGGNGGDNGGGRHHHHGDN